MRGVAEMLEQTSYELVLYSINDADLEKDRSEVINRVLATQLTAGLLAVFPGPASQDLTRLYKQGFPVVIVDEKEIGPRVIRHEEVHQPVIVDVRGHDAPSFAQRFADS